MCADFKVSVALWGVCHIPACVLQWFLANLSYQEALSDTQVAIVNILSSTSGDSFPHNIYTVKQKPL